MNKYNIPYNNNNYINNIPRKYIFRTKTKFTPHFGEKIQEKNNYVLYSSGNNKSYYELFPKETQFKPQRIEENKKLYNNKSFISYRVKKNKFQIKNIPKIDKIMNISQNYGYKESLNIKNNDPILKPLTIHDKQIFQPKFSPKITKKINNKIKVWKREVNQKFSENQGFRVIQENKSSDNILRKKSNYRIIINNEIIPNNHKSKITKITKIKPGELKEIYQKKYVKQNEYLNNMETSYINKYTKKSYEPIQYLNKKNNYNRYFINNNYESNGNYYNNTFAGYREILGDEESNNIVCPVHGNIAIVVHTNRNKKDRKYNLYNK